MKRTICVAAVVGMAAGVGFGEVPMPTVSRVPQSSLGPRLTLDPWLDDSYMQSDSFIGVEEKGHLKGADSPFAPAGSAGDKIGDHVVFMDWWGRARLTKTQSDAGSAGKDYAEFGLPVVGFRWASVDFGMKQKGYPSQFQDVAVAVGSATTVSEVGLLSAVVGVGYSGNSPFNDGDATYGIGHVADVIPLGDGARVVLSLDFDGNRGLFPDAPLPGVAYVREGKDWRVWLGLTEMSVVWRPMDKLTVEASWGLPETAGARVNYEIGAGFSAYGTVDNFFDGFWYSSDSRDRRLFFQQRRAEIGVRYTLGKMIDVSLGGGYAWDQELLRGFDDRDLHDFASFEDGAFVMIRLGGGF